MLQLHNARNQPTPWHSWCRVLAVACSVLGLMLCSALMTCAQSAPHPLPTPPPDQKPKSILDDDKPNLGPIEEEMRVKQSIRAAEKEYKENVERAREAAELGVELRDALNNGHAFGREESKKLDRLEKLAKKIRDEAGGCDEELQVDDPPGKLETAVSRLADVASSLYKSIEKTPRQVVSAAVIEEANVLLKLARLTKNFFH